MNKHSEAIGIDLGGTQIKAVVVAHDGGVQRRELRETKDDNSAAFAASIRELSHDLGPALPVGLAAPGLVSADGRSIAHLPGRLGGLEGLDWTDFLGRPVPVTNDAHASLIGECRLGAARGLSDAILLTLGTGVGGAILSEGRVLRGHIGRAGHLGHATVDYRSAMSSIVGMPGALECMMGNYNIRERTHGRFDTTHALILAAEQGEPGAREMWMDSIRALAAAIASFINILDPEAVIIGGGIAQAGEALFRPLAAELDRIEWQPAGHRARLIPAALGEWAGAIGAARQALDS